MRRPVAPGARRNIRQQKGSSQIGVHRHCGYGAGLRGSLAERASAECRQRISRAIGACDEDHDATMGRPAIVAARAACRVPPQPPHPVTGAHLREKPTHAPGTAPPDQPSVPLTHRGRKCRADKPCAVRTAGHRQLDARSWTPAADPADGRWDMLAVQAHWVRHRLGHRRLGRVGRNIRRRRKKRRRGTRGSYVIMVGAPDLTCWSCERACRPAIRLRRSSGQQAVSGPPIRPRVPRRRRRSAYRAAAPGSARAAGPARPVPRPRQSP